MKHYKIDYQELDSISETINSMIESIETFKKYHSKVPEVLADYLEGETLKAIESVIEEHVDALDSANENLEEIFESINSYKEELRENIEEEFFGPIFLETSAVHDLMSDYKKITSTDVKAHSKDLDDFIDDYERKVRKFNERVNNIDYSNYSHNEETLTRNLISVKQEEIDNFYINKQLYADMQEILTNYNNEIKYGERFSEEQIELLNTIDDLEDAAYHKIVKIAKLIFNLSPLGHAYKAIKEIGSIMDEHPWVMGIVHTGLSFAGMVPGIGWACDSANAAIYALEGDWANAAFSAASVVPGVAMAGYATKGFKSVDTVGDVTKLLSSIEKGEDASKILKNAHRVNELEEVADTVDNAVILTDKIDLAMKIKRRSDFGVFTTGTAYNTYNWITSEELTTDEITFGVINDYYIGTFAKGFSFAL